MPWRSTGRHLDVLFLPWCTVMTNVDGATSMYDLPRGQLDFADEFEGRSLPFPSVFEIDYVRGYALPDERPRFRRGD